MTLRSLKMYLRHPKKLFIRIGKNSFMKKWSDEKYLKFLYSVKFGKKLDLDNPETFNEKLQWLKIHDRKPEYTSLVDKAEVKRIVAEKIGEEYIIPTLGVYDKWEEIDFDKLPESFVIKCTHDSGGLVIVKDKNKLDKKAAKKKIEKCLKRNYYYSTREWPYKNVKPRIIVEKYIDIGDKENHFDYKFMCFNGQPKYLFLDVGVIDNGGHAEDYYRNIYDVDFNLMNFFETRKNTDFMINKPKNYDRMVFFAAKLSEGLPHVRVDLYNIDGRIYFGELTFYHGSGFNDFYPEEWDYKFGEMISLPKSE